MSANINTNNLNKQVDDCAQACIAAIEPTLTKDLIKEILNIIADIFNIEFKDITNIKQMKKGMTNLSFLFDVKGNRYVFRVPGSGTNLLVVRSEEALTYNKIKGLNLSDEIVYIDSTKGYKITKFYEDVKPVDPYDKEEVKKAISKLRQLHKADLQVKHEFDIIERINHYREICKHSKVGFTKEYYLLSEKVDKITSFISKNRNESRLCHIDPVSANFLVFKDGSMRLIDWEYAGMSDPIIDIAMFGISQQYSEDQINNLLKVYFKRRPTLFEQKVFYAYVALSSYLWYLWTLYKEALGDSYQSYLTMQFNFSNKYSDKFRALNNNL